MVEPTRITVPTRHGPVACWIYRPEPHEGVRPPVHLMLHGGGFILTNPRQDEHISHYLASEVGAVVVAVDYSTAPAARFPVAEQECYDVLVWVAANGDQQCWDGDRISVGGFSAGGKLVLSTLQLAHREHGPAVRAAFCGFPVLDVAMDPAQLSSSIAKPMIRPAAVAMIQNTYFVDPATRADPLASPALDPDLAAALPPTLFLAAEFDTLTPLVHALAERLTREGAPVTERTFAGRDHAWTHSRNDADVPALREAVQLMAEHLRAHVCVG